MSSDAKSYHPHNVPTVSANTAPTESSLKKAWVKCMQAEEANNYFKKLLAEGVGTNQIEYSSKSKAGRAKWENRGEEGRKQIVSNEVKTLVLDSACKIRKLKEIRRNMTEDLKRVVSNNVFKRRMGKIFEELRVKREILRSAHDKNVEWMKLKHGRMKDEFCVPDEVSEFSK